MAVQSPLRHQRINAFSPPTLLTNIDTFDMKTQIQTNKQSENEPSEDKIQAIQACAYKLYEKRGGKPGNELDDWLEAEKIVRLQGNKQRDGAHVGN